MRNLSRSVFVCLVFLSFSSIVYSQNLTYQLVWSDEFNGYNSVDTNKWFHQTKLPIAGSWYNGEIQHYTDRAENSSYVNGVLRVTAKKETYTNQGFTKEYTSARLNSKFAFKYGRVEYRAKLPTGTGTWPAVWLLGKNIQEPGAYWDNNGFGTLSWPACGEIDMLEHWGSNQNFVQSALHTLSSYGNTVNKGGLVVNTASTEFHVYAMEWTDEKIVFSIDSIEYYTYNPPIKNLDTWPFDSEFYILINFAIQNNIATTFTLGALEIDYLRVYQKKVSQGIATSDNTKNILFPNPTNKQINISLPYTSDNSIDINIYGIDGKLIKTENAIINNNIASINDVSNLENGLYFLTYSINGKIFRNKFYKN